MLNTIQVKIFLIWNKIAVVRMTSAGKNPAKGPPNPRISIFYHPEYNIINHLTENGRIERRWEEGSPNSTREYFCKDKLCTFYVLFLGPHSITISVYKVISE